MIGRIASEAIELASPIGGSTIGRGIGNGAGKGVASSEHSAVVVVVALKFLTVAVIRFYVGYG